MATVIPTAATIFPLRAVKGLESIFKPKIKVMEASK